MIIHGHFIEFGIISERTAFLRSYWKFQRFSLLEISKMCLHILSCLFPPLAVCFKRGVGCDCLINVLLTILGWIPGCCHACYVVSQDKTVVHHQTVVVQQPMPGPPVAGYVAVNVSP
ncbi:Plasma membrane proteolipid 3 [Orchesella cincta]|uniref:Plasma membrane proteolipid 3 n=1 Tax=Orchesella cincta TaxID=48709 RepID=A0A1D2N040_ORCCI|nr:Plasma membrane proteolipid 3 [Orchesella cincta]